MWNQTIHLHCRCMHIDVNPSPLILQEMATYLDRLPRELLDLLEHYRTSPSYRIRIEARLVETRVIVYSPELEVCIRIPFAVDFPSTNMKMFLAGQSPEYYSCEGTLTLRDGYLIVGCTKVKLSPELKHALVEAESYL